MLRRPAPVGRARGVLGGYRHSTALQFGATSSVRVPVVEVTVTVLAVAVTASVLAVTVLVVTPDSPRQQANATMADTSQAGRHVHVYIHTDGTWERPPSRGGFVAHAGWSGQLKNLSAVREQWDCCWRAPANVDSCYKYEWLMHASAAHRRRRSSWLGVLSDSDVLFQCSAEEMRQRFRRLGTPLVVSGERQWYPIPKRYPDPFGPAAHWANLSWSDGFRLRRQRQFYPNSGLIMGTADGFESLASALHATPGFPCCAFEGDAAGFQLDACSSCRPIRRFKAPVRCAVEDQACLQVALAARGAPRHAIDRNASLFLSLSFLRPADLALKGGRLAFKHTGEVPCVLHSNGYKDLLAYVEPHLAPRGGAAAADTAPLLWAVSSLAARRARRGYAEGRRFIDHGAWASFQLPVLPVEKPHGQGGKGPYLGPYVPRTRPSRVADAWADVGRAST